MYQEAENENYLVVNTNGYHRSVAAEISELRIMPLAKQLEQCFTFLSPLSMQRILTSKN